MYFSWALIMARSSKFSASTSLLRSQEQFMEPAPQAEGDKGCAVEMQDRNMEPPGFRERLDVASHVLQTYMLRNVVAQRMQDHTPVRAVLRGRTEVAFE